MLSSEKCEFGVMSNTLWKDFHVMACMHLKVSTATAQLAYQLCDAGYSLGGFTHIEGDNKWLTAISATCNAMEKNKALEVELLDVTKNISDKFW
jgi:hypothetical protein